MKTILVPTDYSSNAQHAIEYAVMLAKCFDAKLIVLHTFHLPAVRTSSDGSVVPTDSISSQEFSQQQTGHIKQLACQIAATYRISVEGIAIEAFLVDALPNLVKKLGVDLVVMGRCGMGITEHLVGGSITTLVLNLAQFPILILPADASLQPPKKLLFACAYPTLPATHTLRLLRTIIQVCEAEVAIFHVEEAVEAFEQEADCLVSSPHVDDVFRGIPHPYCFLEDENLVSGIERALEEYQPDWLVMIPQAHGFAEPVLSGGDSYQMAFRSTIPLLALPNENAYT